MSKKKRNKRKAYSQLSAGTLMGVALVGGVISSPVSAEEVASTSSEVIAPAPVPSTETTPTETTLTETTPSEQKVKKEGVSNTSPDTNTEDVVGGGTSPTSNESLTLTETTPTETGSGTDVDDNTETKPNSGGTDVEVNSGTGSETSPEDKGLTEQGIGQGTEQGSTPKTETIPDDKTGTNTEIDTPKLSKVTVKLTVDGKETSISEGDSPIKLELSDTLPMVASVSDKDLVVKYQQILSNGTVLNIEDSSLLPVTSTVVATYADKDGKSKSLLLADLSSKKEYKLNVSYSEATNTVGYTFDSSQLVKGDTTKGTYTIYSGDTKLVTVSLEDGNEGGVAELISRLPEGTNTLKVEGVSRYGIKSVGTLEVVIKKPVVPTPNPNEGDGSNKGTEGEGNSGSGTPDNNGNSNTGADDSSGNSGNTGTVTPTPTPAPNPDFTPDTGGSSNNVNTGNAGDSGTGGNSGTGINIITPKPEDNTSTVAPVPTPEPPKEETPKEETPKEETPVVKEPPKGINNVTVGGVSIYGNESNSTPSVASNGNTTTFTDARNADVRVTLDTNVVDSSRTVLKLVGRSQGELNTSDFVELKDGTYRIKGIAKDDFYTLTIKAYDRTGNLVTDTVETFSINKGGSKYTLNESIAGKSVQSLTSNIQVEEVNVDKIDSDKTTVRVYRNGKLIKLSKSAIKVVRTGGVNSNWKYTYSIDKSAFNEDGVYTLELFSTSETGVKYDSTKRTLQFTVDTTGAEISVSGIRNGGRYKSATKRITIDIRDISNLKSVKAYLNGKEVKLQYDEDTGMYYYDIKSSGQGKNEFTVEVEDEAGNVSTSTTKDFYLSKDLAFSIFNDNNLLFLLGGIASAAAMFLGFLAFRRKKALDEEDRLALEQAELLAASHSSNQPKSSQVDVLSSSTGGRIAVEELIPESENITPDVEEVVEEVEDVSTGDDVPTDFLPDEDVIEDENPTDVISEEIDSEATDIIQEESEEEDIKPTDIIEE